MLRPVTLALAFLASAAACTLVEPPLPPGNAFVQLEVRNSSPDGVVLTLETETGERTDAVQPASVAPGATADVTLIVPTDEAWWLVLAGPNRGPLYSTIDSTSIEGLLGQTCKVVLNLRANDDKDLACLAR